MYNVSKDDLIFLRTLKTSDLGPIHNKEELTIKIENYRSVNLH